MLREEKTRRVTSRRWVDIKILFIDTKFGGNKTNEGTDKIYDGILK